MYSANDWIWLRLIQWNISQTSNFIYSIACKINDTWLKIERFGSRRTTEIVDIDQRVVLWLETKENHYKIFTKNNILIKKNTNSTDTVSYFINWKSLRCTNEGWSPTHHLHGRARGSPKTVAHPTLVNVRFFSFSTVNLS